ncbi:MAG: hypothetical protein AAF733_08340 [Verrucomicrobiota bacterium]
MIVFSLLLAVVGCEEPRLRTAGVDPEEKDAVPEEWSREEERDLDARPESIVDRFLPGKSEPEDKSSTEVRETKVEPPASENTPMTEQELALKRQMLEAQRKGVETLESDLSRHSIQLASLKAEWQRVRVLKSNQGGGIRVERIGGQSNLVDRGAQIRELESKIRAEEELIAQLSQSLKKARAEYLALSKEVAKRQQP